MTMTMAVPMTALDPGRTEHAPRILRGPARPTRRRWRGEGAAPAVTGPETWFAASACGRWTYERTETTSTPWVVTYVPTGQSVMFTSLDAGRRWTARDDGAAALATLMGEARRVVARGGRNPAVMTLTAGAAGLLTRAGESAERVEQRLGMAVRAVHVLDGLVIAGEPDTRCTGGDERVCGGYLTAVLVGARASWVHTDACRECVTGAPSGGCPELHTHVACGDADPVLCEHDGCSVVTLPILGAAGQCRRGRDACCGCCTYDG